MVRSVVLTLTENSRATPDEVRLGKPFPPVAEDVGVEFEFRQAGRQEAQPGRRIRGVPLVRVTWIGSTDQGGHGVVDE